MDALIYCLIHTGDAGRELLVTASPDIWENESNRNLGDLLKGKQWILCLKFKGLNALKHTIQLDVVFTQ